MNMSRDWKHSLFPKIVYFFVYSTVWVASVFDSALCIPGTSRSFQTSTSNRVSYDRKAKKQRQKMLLDALSKKSLTDTGSNDGLHSWSVWIEQLSDHSRHVDATPLSLEASEDSGIGQDVARVREYRQTILIRPF